MKQLLLTSTGFTNKNIKEKFLEQVKKEPKEIKALFITTAAVEVDAILVLPSCLEDLLDCNIPKENITIYDMHNKLKDEEICKYDLLYVCGGKTTYLAERMQEVNFRSTLENYLNQGGIYIGVSAGSVVMGDFPQGLNMIENAINVHCEIGCNNGPIKNKEKIRLTDNQAILITEEETIIFE